MKNFKVTGIIFVSIILQSFFITSMAKTEEQAYKVVHSEKEFEIRYYPKPPWQLFIQKPDHIKSFPDQVSGNSQDIFLGVMNLIPGYQ